MRILLTTLTLIITSLLEQIKEINFVGLAQAGVVKPEKPNSVLPYRNNEKAMGKYTFYFKISSPVNSNPLISIDFPSTYPKLMPDIEKCKGRIEVLLRSESQYLDCVVTDNRIVFDLSKHWSELDAGNLVIDIFDIINPTGTAESTGNFALRTWSGSDIVIDNNLIFQGIGFATFYSPFASSVKMINDGADIAGYFTNYVIEFTTSANLLKGSWFRLEFPSGFGFGESLECYVEGFADDIAPLPCYAENRTLFMKDLKQDLPSGVLNRVKMKNIRNPYTATSDTGTFVFETMKEGVNTVIDYEGFVPGISISAGQITETVVVGFPLVQNLFVDYSIKFKPMNSIPEDGAIVIQFPNTYQGLDTSCRVISGLEKKVSGASINCVTQTDPAGDKLIITNFGKFAPKFIEVKCFAYNPPTGGETPNWKIATYTDSTLAQQIDRNDKAGTVPISSINKPYFVGADLYKQIFNCSWLERCPIDYRFFPNPGNNLTRYTDNSNYGNIELQIPLWWFLWSNSSIPECIFGDEPGAKCYQREHVFTSLIPKTQDYEYCELPISVKYARMTPIPGKFPFRVLSFKDGSKWYPSHHWKTPIEQDTYIMDIPIVSISVLQTYASASEANDEDNLLHIRCNIHPFLFDYEGTVFVNVSHVYNSLDDSSGWPLKFGKVAADNTHKQIPCKVYVNGRETGHLSTWDYHPDVRCFLRAGDSTLKNNSLIQVVGFGRNIEKGNYFEILLPDIKYCHTEGRLCKLTVGYTMVHDVDFPYIINSRENSLGKVNPFYNNAIDPNVTRPRTSGTGNTRSNEKCRPTDLYVYAHVTSPIKKGDYFVIKRVLSHWNFTKTRHYTFRYESGRQINAWAVLDFEHDLEHIIVRVDEEIPVKDNYRFRIRYLTNTPWEDNESIIGITAWSDRIKVLKTNSLWSKKSTYGGILYFFQRSTDSGRLGGYHSDMLDSRHRGAARSGGSIQAIKDYHVPLRIVFKTCNNIPYDGQIRVKFLHDDSGSRPMYAPEREYGVQPKYCRVWRQVINQKANESHVKCIYEKDGSGVEWFKISEFETIMNLTSYVEFHWIAEISATLAHNPQQLKYDIFTYNKTTDLDANYVDKIYEYSWYPDKPNVPGITIDSVKAPHYRWYKKRKYQYDMYKGLRGSFIFNIQIGLTDGAHMLYNLAENNYFEFEFDESITHPGNLECRYAEITDLVSNATGHHYPSVQCETDDYTAGGKTVRRVRMRLHPWLHIDATKRYNFILDSRHHEMTEGFTFTQPGVYTLTINNFVAGVQKQTSKQQLEVFGTRIPHFFIYSMNKLVEEETMFIVWAEFFNNQRITTSSVTASKEWTMAVYFETDNEGFEQDLGTGFPDQGKFPCKVHYLALETGIEQMNCTIYYGRNKAPARIEIKGFKQCNSRYIRIDIPAVKNPKKKGIVPQVWFKILESVGDPKVTSVVWEGHYYELNVTWTKYAPWYQKQDTETYNHEALTIDTQELNVDGTLGIPLKLPRGLHGEGVTTPMKMHENDYIVLKFPNYWPVPYDISNNDCINFNTKNEECYSIRDTTNDYHIIYSKVNSNGLTDGKLLKLKMTTAQSVVPKTTTSSENVIRSLIYHDTRLIAEYRHTNHDNFNSKANPIDFKVDCNPTNPLEHKDTEYMISFSLPDDLIQKSLIRIDYPDYIYPAGTPTCRQGTVGTIPLGVCKVYTGAGETFLTLDQFGTLAGETEEEITDMLKAGNKVELIITLTNPAAQKDASDNFIKKNWRVSTYSIGEATFAFLLGDSNENPNQTPALETTHLDHCTIKDVNEPTYIWPEMFHETDRTRCKETGPLVFIYESAIDLSADDDYIEVDIPQDFKLDFGEYVANWVPEYPREFSLDSTSDPSFHKFKIYKPKYSVAGANKRYILNLTTLDGVDNVNGWVYPDDQGIYYANIRTYKGGVQQEEGNAKIFVFQKNFKNFESKSYLMNSGYRASFLVKIVPGEALGSGGKFIFKLPTATYKYKQTVKLFASDGGTGLSDGSPINCHGKKNGVYFSSNPNCVFYHGSQENGIPARVEMTNLGSFAATDKIELTFDGFKHPDNGDDKMNVEPSVEFHESGGTHKFTGIDYDYTIVDDNDHDDLVDYANAISFSDNTVGSKKTSFFIKFKVPIQLDKYQSGNGLGWADYIIIEFPEGYEVSLNTIAKAQIKIGPSKGDSNEVSDFLEYSAGNNWIIWRVDDINKIEIDTEYQLMIKGVDQAVSLPASPIFKLFVVKNRLLIREIQYESLSFLSPPEISSSDITFEAVRMPAGEVPKKKYQKWKFTFIHRKTLNQGGQIQITLPDTLSNPDSNCYNADDSNLQGLGGDDIYCKWDAAKKSYYITNYQNSGTTDEIKLYIYAQSEDAAPGAGESITVRAFKDYAMQYILAEGTVSVPNLRNSYGFAQLKFDESEQEIKEVLRKTESAPMKLKVHIPTGWTDTTSFFTVTFPASASLPTGSHLVCHFGDYEASKCEATSTSPLTVKVHAPYTPTLNVGDSYDLTLSSTCGDTNERGIKFSTAGVYSVSVDYSGTTSYTKFKVYSTKFSQASFRVLYSSKAQNNAIKIKLKTTTAIPTTGKLRFRLPRVSSNGKILLWNSMGLTAGQYLENKCRSVSSFFIPTKSVITCYFYQDETSNVWEISDFQAITANGDIEFVIYDIVNPTVTDDYTHIDAIIESVDNTGALLDQTVLFDVFAAIDTTPSTELNSNPQAITGNTLLQTGVEYKYTGIPISPALKTDDQVVFEYPASFFFPFSLSKCSGTVAAGTYKSFGRYVVFTPTTDISGTKTFCFKSAKNPYGNYAGKVKVHIVYSRSTSKIVSFNTPGYTEGSATVTLTAASGVNRASDKHTFEIDTSDLVPAYGVITFTYPSGFTYIGATVRSGFKAESRVWVDTSSGKPVVYVKTRQLYNGATDANVIVDIYMKNHATAGAKSIKVEGHALDDLSSRIWTKTTSLTVAGTSAAQASCYLSATPLSSAISATSTFNVFVAAAETKSVTALGTSGYDMISHTAGSGDGCQGIPLYVKSATSFGGASITLGHLSTSNLNYAKIAGTTASNFDHESHFFSVDIGNHDSDLLGATADAVKSTFCQLKVGGTLVRTTCKLRKGTEAMSPGIEIRTQADIASGATIELIVSHFKNPSVARLIEVRMRHVENSIGNKLTDLVSSTQEFTITAATPTADAKALTLTDKAQNTAGFDLDFTAATATNAIILFLPNDIGGLDTYPTTTTQFDSTYPGSGVFVIDSLASAASITVADFPLPTAGTGTDPWIAVSVTGTAVTEVITFTPTDIQSCDITGLVMEALSKNNADGLSNYAITWTTTCNLPPSSSLKIDLPVYMSNIEVGLIDFVQGTIDGSYYFSVSGNTIELSNYKYIAAGTYKMRLTLKADIGSGATASTLKAETPRGKTIFTSSSTLPKVTSNNKVISQIYRDYLRLNKKVVTDDYGYLSLIFQTVGSVAGTDFLYLAPPTGFKTSFGYHTRCKFVDLSDEEGTQALSKYCRWDSAKEHIEIQMPQDMTISENKIYRLEIFHVGESDPGIRFASSPSSFEFKVTLKSNGGTIKEEFKSDIIVSKHQPTMSCFKNFLSNSGKKNVFMMKFNPKETIPSDGFLEFEFPNSILMTGAIKTSFDQDLGTSLYHGQAITCKAFTDSGSKSTWATNGCYLKYGGPDALHRKSIIEVKLANAMTAGTKYVIDLYGIKNPAANEILSSVRLLGGQYSGSTKLYTNVQTESKHIYTSNPTPQTETARNLPSISPTEIQLATSFNLAVNTGSSVSLTANHDHIRLEYNSDMRNSAVDATDFEPFDVEGGLAYFYSQTDKATNFNLELSDMNTPDSAAPTFASSFKVQIIKDKVIKHEIPYNPNGNSFSAVDFTSITTTPTTARKGELKTFKLSIQFSKILRATGSIEITLQNMDSIGTVCTEETGLIGSNYKCEQSSATSLRISGVKEVPVATTLQFSFEAKAKSNDATGKICAAAYGDTPASLGDSQTDVVQKVKCFSLAFSGFPVIKWFEARTPLKRWRIQAEETGTLSLLFNTEGTTLTKYVDYITVSNTDGEFKNDKTLDFVCFFNDYIAKSCNYSVADKQWKIYIPREYDLVSGTDYLLTIKSWRQKIEHNRDNGIDFPVEKDYPLPLKGHKGSDDSDIFTAKQTSYYVPPWKFVYMYFNSFLWKTNSLTNMRAKFKLFKDVKTLSDTELGQIMVEYEVKNPQASDVFKKDLDTSIINGNGYECVGYSEVDCKLFHGSDLSRAKIIIYPKSDLIATPTDLTKGNLKMLFPSLKTPLDQFTLVEVKVTAQNYDKATEKWTKVSEYVNDIFVTMDHTPLTSSASGPTIADKKVGAKNTVTFTFDLTASYGDIQTAANSLDKLILKTNKEVLEIIMNKKTGMDLDCPGFTYNIYYDTDVIEFTPNAKITAGTTVNLLCNNWFNPQYVIRGGMTYMMEVWINGILQEIITFDNINYTPNLLNPSFKEIGYSASPGKAETQTVDTYTFTLKPTNYIREYGKIEIHFDKKFSQLSNCEIGGNSLKGICELIDNPDGGTEPDKIVLKELKYYNPDSEPQFTVKMQMKSPIDAGTYSFDFVSFWKINADPALEDKIDEENIGSIEYEGLPTYEHIFKFNQYMYTRETCWNGDDHGTFQFEIAFSDVISWPDKEYIILYPFQFGRRTWDYSRDPYISEFICYFDFDHILYSVKSERCYIKDSYLYIWPPEETNLPAGNRMIINIEWRGQRDRGVSTSLFPKQRHIMVYTNSSKTAINKEVGILEWQGRACYFRNRDYHNTAWHQLHNSSLDVLDGAWEQYNRESDWNGRDFRIQAQYTVYNEFKIVSYPAPRFGFGDNTAINQTKKLPCMYVHGHNDFPWPNRIWSWDNICEAYNAPSAVDYGDFYRNTMKSTAVLTLNNITNRVYGDVDMRWGVGGMWNYQILNMLTKEAPTYWKSDVQRNTFIHLTVQSQVMLDDGNWYDTHRVTKWRHYDHIKMPMAVAQVTGYSSINRIGFGLIHITMVLTMSSVPSSHSGFSFKWYQLEDPWWMHPRNKTHSNRYCRNKASSIRCLLFDQPIRWVVHRVSANTGNWMTLKHFGMMESPTFGIIKPFYTSYSLGADVKYHIVDLHEVTKLIPNVIQEMDYRHNPQGVKVYYRIGVLTWRYQPWTKFFRFYLPTAYKSIGPHCRVNFGFRKPFIEQFERKTKCAINPATGYRGVMDFYDLYHWSRRWWDQYDGYYIFDMDLENPDTAQWTPDWKIQAYDNYYPPYNVDLTGPPLVVNVTRLQIYTNNGHSRPRTWVATDTTTPVANYFRVFRNRETFEERRQKAGEWAELHVRLYPTNVIPKDIGKVEIQLPLDYDIPNGGEKICEVGHFNHTDLDGQFCEILSDRQVRVRTNQQYGLESKCTIIRITTEGAVGYRDGFQAPPVATTGSFDIYLWKDTQLLEYMGDSNSPDAVKLEQGKDINITISCNEENQKSVVNVSFNALVQIRAGYDSDPLQTDVFKKKPQGRIHLKFNTRDKYNYGKAGFKTDITDITGSQLNTPYPIKCVAFGPLTVPDGEELICEIYKAAEDNFYTPASIIVRNFNFIPKSTQNVEVHILNIDWTRDYRNKAWIEFTVYEEYGDGKNQTLYDGTKVENYGQDETGISNSDLTRNLNCYYRTSCYKSGKLTIDSNFNFLQSGVGASCQSVSGTPNTYNEFFTAAGKTHCRNVNQIKSYGNCTDKIHPEDSTLNCKHCQYCLSELPIFIENLVGYKLDLTFPFLITGYIYQKDSFEVTFPDMFEFPSNDSDISAIFKVTKNLHRIDQEDYFFTAKVVIYRPINEVHFKLPKGQYIYGCTTSIPCMVEIKTSGFRHASYAAPNPFDIKVRIINKLKTYKLYTFKDIPPPAVNAFNSKLVTASSQFSEDVYVTYQFSITPSYHYPATSLIKITLDYDKFRQIDKSYPKAICNTNFNKILDYCNIKEALIEIKLKGKMEEGFPAEITLTGVKNPKFVGVTDNNDIFVEVFHPTGYKINEGYMNNLNFKSKRNVDTMFFNIKLTSYYEEVTSDYEFVLQNTNRLPPLGTINIQLPSDWAKILPDDAQVDKLVGSFTTAKLIYSAKFVKEPSNNILLQITPEFEWPAKSPLTVKFTGLINPKNLPITGVFRAYTKYDSEMIDQSDTNDPASKIKFIPYTPKITMWKTEFTPMNEVEHSVYTFKLSSADKLFKGQCLQFIFPENYDSLLIDYTKILKCTSPTITFTTCTHESRIAKLCLGQNIEEDEIFSVVLNGIMNPNYLSVGKIDISTTDSSNKVLQFTNDIAFFEPIPGPTPVPLTKVQATSYDILVKADYDFCMQAPGTITKDAVVLIDFPKQFSIRKPSYTCQLGSGHDTANLPYASGVKCTVNNELRRFEISGQTAAYSSATKISLCYKIFEVENSQDTGESFNFIMRVYDKPARKILFKTVGILDYPSTLSYKRSGLRTFISAIPDIPVGTMSNDIEVTLESSVPYDIVLTPQATGFTFEPASINMKFNQGPTQKFRIIPEPGVDAGEYRITWVKQEMNDGAAPRFSEIPDTYFNVKKEPDYRQLRLTISQNVYRTPLDAESMPVYVELSHPASKKMTLYYKTKQPFQPEFVNFTPKELVFEAGETKKQFTYKATDGAVSGLIDLELEPDFQDVYYMPEKTINFEVQDKDNTPPKIVTEKIISKSGTKLKLRVSADENTKIYYMASFKGTQTPPVEEIMDPAKRALSKKKPELDEIMGSAYSDITKSTKTYVYHDTFIEIDNLIPDRDYELFMLPVDMFGNVGEIKKIPFTTNKVPPPVKFNLKAKKAVTDQQFKDALSLVTGVLPENFEITYRPDFSSISTGEKEVEKVLENSALDYEIMILPNATADANSPYEILKQIMAEVETLLEELPQLVENQSIGESGREILVEGQKIMYPPLMIDVSNFYATFNASLAYTGTIYGVILPKEEPSPSAIQIRYGLTHQNYQVEKNHKISAKVTVEEDRKYRIWPATTLNFTFLYHSTEYATYWIADRDSYGAPVLMKDDEVVKVVIKTQRELFFVGEDVVVLSIANTVRIWALFLMVVGFMWW